jgi:hypothetical protein
MDVIQSPAELSQYLMNEIAGGCMPAQLNWLAKSGGPRGRLNIDRVCQILKRMKPATLFPHLEHCEVIIG